MPRGVTPEDLYRIQQPSECRISPDGTKIAVVVAKSDKETLKQRRSIWIVPTSGPKEPFQFTHGKGYDSHPRFSPDGTTLAFLSDRSGKSEIWTMPIDGGEARQLTKLGGSIREFSFSPDGKRIAAVFSPEDPEAKQRAEKKKKGEPGQESPKVRSIERILYKIDGLGFLPKGRAHIWLIQAASGRARQLTRDDRFEEAQPEFSPDGKWIYFASNRCDDPDFDLMRIDLWRIPSGGGRIAKVRTFDGPSADYTISPDGKWIAFLGTPEPDGAWGRKFTKLWLVPSRGGRPTELSARLDRVCENTTITDTLEIGGTQPPTWSPDSQWVYFIISNEGNSEVWRVHIRDRTPTPVINLPGAVLNYTVHFPTWGLYATFSTEQNPGELVVFARAGRRMVRAMTEWNAWLKSRRIAIPEEFWFRGKGRHRVHGWILRPPRRGRGKGPAIVYIHGGPATQYGRVYFHEFQVLAARGYTIFYSNPRGGTGYSERHMSAIHNAWGTVDFDDLMAFTDEALRRCPEVDRRRLGVAGGSYGGYMTNWIIGHTNRFAAAVTQRSVVNLLSFCGTSDFGYAWPRVFGGKPAWRDSAHYLKMSPILYADAMRTPTLIEHQERDDRCPVEQAEQLYAALKARKVPTEFHRYPDESHGMSRGGRPDRRIERMKRIATWFDRWLVAPRMNRGNR